MKIIKKCLHVALVLCLLCGQSANLLSTPGRGSERAVGLAPRFMAEGEFFRAHSDFVPVLVRVKKTAASVLNIFIRNPVFWLAALGGAAAFVLLPLKGALIASAVLFGAGLIFTAANALYMRFVSGHAQSAFFLFCCYLLLFPLDIMFFQSFFALALMFLVVYNEIARPDSVWTELGVIVAAVLIALSVPIPTLAAFAPLIVLLFMCAGFGASKTVVYAIIPPALYLFNEMVIQALGLNFWIFAPVCAWLSDLAYSAMAVGALLLLMGMIENRLGGKGRKWWLKMIFVLLIVAVPVFLTWLELIPNEKMVFDAVDIAAYFAGVPYAFFAKWLLLTYKPQKDDPLNPFLALVHRRQERIIVKLDREVSDWLEEQKLSADLNIAA